MADAPTPAKPLEKLGKYELRGVLGKGAMGIVYDGWDPMIERRVAIKTARLPDPGDVEAQEELGRFRREAQAAGRLSHPNIVGVYDSGETDGVAYFVMELVEGQSLKEMLAREQRMTPGDAVAVMEEVLAGLNYSHARGVIHRDIKPANVMMTRAGQAKIADFGIARIESSSMTQAGTMMGTPAYMSPEQFMGQTVDSRTDIYSAGILLYQLLTGERPFEGSITAIMHKALNTTPPRPSELSVTVKPALDAVVSRAMARRPEDRFSTAAEFAAALRAAYEAPETTLPPVTRHDDDATMVAPPAHPAPRPASAPLPALPAAAAKSRAPLMIAGLTAVLVLGAGGAYLAISERAPERASGVAADAGSKPEPPGPVALPDGPEAERAPDQAALTEPSTQPAPDPQVAVLPPLRTAPPLTAAPDPAVSRAALSSALKDVPCTLSDVTTGSDGMAAVSSVAGAAQADAVRRAAGGAPAAVRTVNGRFCRTLDLLRSVSDGLAMSLELRDGVTRLRDRDVIAPILTLPDSPMYMRLDYFSNDGKVTHLYPSHDDVELPFAAHQNWQPKAGPKLTPWTVGPPFGSDMIAALASSAPLLTVHRPSEESADAYVSALQFAADALRRQGGRLTSRALVLDTEK